MILVAFAPLGDRGSVAQWLPGAVLEPELLGSNSRTAS